MSHTGNSNNAALTTTAVIDVTDFDWNSVEVSIGGSAPLAFASVIQRLAQNKHPNTKNYRDFRNLPYYDFIGPLGSGRRLQWRDREGGLVIIEDINSWHILLKRFVQQGGNPPYNNIDL